jgi:transposase
MRLQCTALIGTVFNGTRWRDLPERFGPYTTCYNRFIRWRRAGVWGGIMNALAATHDVVMPSPIWLNSVRAVVIGQ